MPPAPPPKPQTLKVPTTGTAHGSAPVVFEDEPPRLAVCLNMTAVDYPDGTTGEGWYAEHTLDVNDPKSIEQILAWIDDRIHRPLTEAWAGPAGELHEAWDAGPAEDAWARALSEVFFGVRYGGPGECYFGGLNEIGGGRWDSYLFSRIQRRSFDYFEVHKVTDKAKPPATYLEVTRYKQKLKQERKSLQSAMIENDDPAVSLATACQHMTTYGALSRGFTLEEHLDGCNFAAAQNGSKAIFNPDTAKNPNVAPQFRGGAWYPTNDAHLKVSVATGLEAPPTPKDAKPLDPAIGPGAIYCYNPFGDAKRVLVYVPSSWVEPDADGVMVVKKEYRDKVGHHITERRDSRYREGRTFVDNEQEGTTVEVPSSSSVLVPQASSSTMQGDTFVEAYLPTSGQKKGSHILFVLRVSKDSKRVQRFDTSNGHPLDRHYEHTIMEPIGKAGIYEGNGEHEIYKGTVFCGMGVLPPPPESLEKQAAFLRRARPIGLLRLVITERRPPRELSDRHVLFTSKLFRMYGDDENRDNFWVSRCAWSLRNTPGFTNLQPWWIIYVPRGDLAQMMWAKGARKRKLSAMEPMVTQLRNRRFDIEQARKKGDPKKRPAPPPPGLLYGKDFRETVVLTNDERGDALYWQRKRSELSFGTTDEKFQGNAIPDVIRAFVAPAPGSDKRLERPWNGEHFDDRYADPDTGSVDVKIPLLFRDGADPNAPAEPELIAFTGDPTLEDVEGMEVAEDDRPVSSEELARS